MTGKTLGAQTSTNISRLTPPVRKSLIDWALGETANRTVTVDWHPLRSAVKDDLTKSVTGQLLGYAQQVGSRTGTHVLVVQTNRGIIAIPDTLIIRIRVGREVILGPSK